MLASVNFFNYTSFYFYNYFQPKYKVIFIILEAVDKAVNTKEEGGAVTGIHENTGADRLTGCWCGR